MHRRIKLGWLAAIAIVTVFVAPRTAFAEPATLERVQIELGVRYAFALEELEYNPWGTGFGGAIGYTLDSAIYLGGSFDWFKGEEVEYPDPTNMYPDPIYVGGNYWQSLVWGGYDMEFSDSFILRPKAGIGISTSTLRDCNSLIGDKIECLKTIRGETSIVPAAELLFVSPILVSIEARFVMLFDSVTIKTAALGGVSLGF
ncbi:MAG TPA: hypothetical protein VI197_16810 [Polyangiaceae bacterium]